jgi:hypothetical protein
VSIVVLLNIQENDANKPARPFHISGDHSILDMKIGALGPISGSNDIIDILYTLFCNSKIEVRTLVCFLFLKQGT